MDEIEESQKKTVEFLKSIKTLDDLKEHKDEVLDCIEDILKKGLEALKVLLESMLSPEDKQEELMKFQDEHFLFSEEMENEMDRIDKLPGASEYMETFQGELEERMEPYLKEITEQMTKFMEGFMGDLMGGLAEGFGEMMGGMGETGEIDGGAELEQGERPDLEVLTFFYEINSVDDLKNEKDNIFNTLEGIIKEDLEELKELKDIMMDEDFNIKSDDPVIVRIDKRHRIIEKELQSEFNRLSAQPGAAEDVESVKDEMIARLKSNAMELESLLQELKKAKPE